MNVEPALGPLFSLPHTVKLTNRRAVPHRRRVKASPSKYKVKDPSAYAKI